MKTHANAPATADRTIRRDVSERLRRFVKEGTTAEMFFMRDVMFEWEGTRLCGDMQIASACAWALDGHTGVVYLEVPEKHRSAIESYLESLKSGEIVELPAASSESGPSVTVQLPKTIRVSEDERVWVARFIRLMRENYWLSHFVRVLLQWEAENQCQTTLEKAEQLLKEQRVVDDLAENVRRLKSTFWKDHPIFKAVREEWEDITEYRDSASLRKLVDSAKNAAQK